MIAAALKHMFAAGMSPEQIIAAVEEMESARGNLPQTQRPSAAAERQRRYRERNALRNGDVTSVTEPSPFPPYDNKNSSTPSNPFVTPLPPKREARAKRLSEDWQPSEGLLSSKHIQKLGLSREVLSFETEAFRDHFLGNGRRMIDWDRCWSNWMREAVRRRSRSGGGSGKSQTAEGFNRAFSRIRAHAAATSNQEPTNVVDLSEVRERGEGVPGPPCDVEPSNGRG